MKPSLDTEVRRLLAARKGDWAAVAAQTDVSYSWLSKFFNGHIANPGYPKLNRLREYLAASARTARRASKAEAEV